MPSHSQGAEAEDEETNFDSQQVESESQPLEEEDETVVSVTTSSMSPIVSIRLNTHSQVFDTAAGRKGVRFYG